MSTQQNDPPHNVPAQVSSFVGREAELAAVRALLGGARLVTLTGAGGAGKTRLALELAAQLAGRTGDGVWLADLAPLADPGLVAMTVAGALGVREEPGRPMLDTLADAIGGRSPLLLLDNCEHVIEACAKLADALLRGCPELTMLATSREPLGIDGERLYRVPSLSVPADDDGVPAIRASEAVRLLADRAAAQGATLAQTDEATRLAGRICRRLDGIPLAIELAAARLRAMSADELDARLDERFTLLTGGSRAARPRQQTLRAVVDWSWELLTEPERVVLARLSVFAGGFGLAAAEAVAADAGVPADEALALLGALVDKSLVQFDRLGAGPGRHRLLETVRQYAAERLAERGSEAAEAARCAHRDYYLALAETATPHLIGPGQVEWMDRLDAELGNLRAAIAVSLTQADPEPGLRLVSTLRAYWVARGHAAEAADALRPLLAAPAAQTGTALRVRALAAAAQLRKQTGAYAIAADCCREGLVIARALGDDRLVAELLCESAWVPLHQGEPGVALPLIAEGLELAGGLGDVHLAARLTAARGYARNADGDPAASARDVAEALRLFRQAGDRLMVGVSLINLSDYEISSGDLEAARRHLAESLDIDRAVGNRVGLIVGTFNLGLAEYLGGSPDRAGPLFAEALALSRRSGMRKMVAYALIGLALAEYGGDGPGWSARLHGAADQAMADLGHALEPVERRLAEADRRRLRAALGDAAFEAEYSAGRALDPARVRPSPGPTDTAAASAPPPSPGSGDAVTVLTPRELDVLKLVAQGLSNADVARRLVLSEHTVHRHLANILRKLGLSSRAAAAAWGVRSGLV